MGLNCRAGLGPPCFFWWAKAHPTRDPCLSSRPQRSGEPGPSLTNKCAIIWVPDKRGALFGMTGLSGLLGESILVHYDLRQMHPTAKRSFAFLPHPAPLLPGEGFTATLGRFSIAHGSVLKFSPSFGSRGTGSRLRRAFARRPVGLCRVALGVYDCHPVRGAARSGALQTRDLKAFKVPDQQRIMPCCAASGMTF